MSDSRVAVWRVAWRELCPWLMLFQAYRIAISSSVLCLALVGVLLTPLGWQLSKVLFVRASDSTALLAEVKQFTGEPVEFEIAIGAVKPPNNGVLIDAYLELARPWIGIFRQPPSFSRIAFLGFGGLWTLAVWALIGGAISRISVLRLGREEWIGALEALRYSGTRFLSYFGAPLFPLVGVVLLIIPLALLGLLTGLDAGVTIAGVFWWLALLGGFVGAILLLGSLFGWPLMWGIISSERDGDIFEAFSRSFSYTFQRPLHYLFYVVVASLFGGLCWVFVEQFLQLILHVTNWGVVWGSQMTGGQEQLAVARSGQEVGTLLELGGTMIVWTEKLLLTFGRAFQFAFFWATVSAIYLLLRGDVDETEWDAVHVEDEEDRYNLQPLSTDKAGVPQVVVDKDVGLAKTPPQNEPAPSTATDGAVEESGGDDKQESS